MSTNTKQQLPVLQALCTSCPKVRKHLIHTADQNLIKCICECCVNVLDGNIKLTETQKERLKKYKKTVRSLGDRKKNFMKKKKEIVQSGGNFLLALTPAAISTILTLLGK